MTLERREGLVRETVYPCRNHLPVATASGGSRFEPCCEQRVGVPRRSDSSLSAPLDLQRRWREALTRSVKSRGV